MGTFLQISADSVFSMNLGFFITLVGIIVSGVMAIFKFNNRIRDKENDIKNISGELKQQQDIYEKSLDRLEDEFKEKLEEYKTLFEGKQSDLKEQVNRVEDKLDKLINQVGNIKCNCK